MIGQRFGRLVVVADLGSRYFSCACDCGATKRVRSDHMASGRTRSCGCFSRESSLSRIKHGGARQGQHLPEYSIWEGIISRCTIDSDTNYARYGAKGVTVCERWRSFENFLSDMGNRPSARHSIDRFPNQTGNYEPGNCRWATAIEQGRNKTSNRILELNGKRATLQERAEITGMRRETIARRIWRGWTVEEALTRSVA